MNWRIKSETRRQFLKGFSTIPLCALSSAAFSEEVLSLQWGDLLPTDDAGTPLAKFRELGVVPHSALTSGFRQPTGATVTEAYNGKVVKIPGYMLPLDVGKDGVSSFILAPFVGACIHVPPPPANQLIFVTNRKPFRFVGLFEPVAVTGEFATVAMGTALAEIGYSIEAASIEPFS